CPAGIQPEGLSCTVVPTTLLWLVIPNGFQSMPLTLTPGTLIVASAYPDPPFDIMDGSAGGFDIELMRAICAQLGLTLQPQAYSGDNFNGIFEGLTKRTCDSVSSGTTIT